MGHPNYLTLFAVNPFEGTLVQSLTSVVRINQVNLGEKEETKKKKHRHGDTDLFRYVTRLDLSVGAR